MRFRLMLVALAVALCQLLAISSAALPGVTPLCDMCTCHNETATNPDVNCTYMRTSVVRQFAFNANNFEDNTNETYPIRSLDLSFCNLRELKQAFPTSGLKVLKLAHNGIVAILEKVFINLEQMEELVLSDNFISDIKPGVFKGFRVDGLDYPLRSLRILRLDGNRMHTLHPDLFQHVEREIEQLYLSRNPIGVIDVSTSAAIGSIVNLKILDLSFTNLKDLPEAFLHSPGKLNALDLSDNMFTAVPKELSNVHVLEVLHFNSNPLTVLDKDNGFPEIPSLKTLRLQRMSALTAIKDGSLSGLSGLVELHITDNIQLQEIQPSILSYRNNNEESENWPRIQKLYIQNNMLTTIDSHLLGHWEMLTDLDFDENVWTCECENQWLIEELMPIMINIDKKRADQIRCSAPIEMKDKFLVDLSNHHKHMRCLDQYGHRPEHDAAILVGVLIGVLIGVPFILFLIFAHQRHWFGVFDKSPAAFSRQFYGPTRSREGVEDF